MLEFIVSETGLDCNEVSVGTFVRAHIFFILPFSLAPVLSQRFSVLDDVLAPARARFDFFFVFS
jgi:hypothetical protein